MKKIILAVGFCFLALSSLSGCATSYGRQNDLVQVYFKTHAPQSTVSCGNEATELPGNIKLKRSSNHDCLAKAPGYQDLHFKIWSRPSGEGFRYSTKVNWQKWSKWTLGLGNLAAWPVDFFSGAMKNFENDRYDLRLASSASVSTSSKVWDKTANMTQKIASIPADVVEETTGAVLNTVVKAPAEALGLSSSQQRKDTEQQIQGQAVAEHLQTTQAP